MNYTPTFFECDISDVESLSGYCIKKKNGEILRDLTGGLTSHSILGWGSDEIAKLVYEQIKTYAHLDYKTFYDPLRDNLAETLLDALPDFLDKSDWTIFYPGLSGSDGIEGAVKIAYQYHHSRGNIKKTEILGFSQSYHGSTVGALAIGDRPNLSFYSELLPKNISRLDEINDFRKPEGMGQESSDLLKYGLANLQENILKIGPSNICCLVGETISGGLTGFVPKPLGYWEGIKKICDHYDIILIADEIICGTGTSGTFYCWEQDAVAPHITVLGKTLAGGYFPCNALLLDCSIADQLKKTTGRIQQSSTFQGHSIAMSAALHIQQKISRKPFLMDIKLKADLIHDLIKNRLIFSDRFLECTGRGLRYSIQLKGSDKDLFARFVTKCCEEQASLIVDGKWHRFTFSPQLDFPVDELVALTNIFCDIFLEVDKKNLHRRDFRPSDDLQKRY